MTDPAFERVAQLASHLPEVTASDWYGTLALKVGGKGFVRMKKRMAL